MLENLYRLVQVKIYEQTVEVSVVTMLEYT